MAAFQMFLGGLGMEEETNIYIICLLLTFAPFLDVKLAASTQLSPPYHFDEASKMSHALMPMMKARC